MCRNAGSRKSGNSLGNGFPAPFQCFSYCNVTQGEVLSPWAAPQPGLSQPLSPLLEQHMQQLKAMESTELQWKQQENIPILVVTAVCVQWKTGRVWATETRLTLTVSSCPELLNVKAKRPSPARKQRSHPALSLSWTDFSEERSVWK